MGTSDLGEAFEAIIKFLIGNRFHVLLSIVSPTIITVFPKLISSLFNLTSFYSFLMFFKLFVLRSPVMFKLLKKEAALLKLFRIPPQKFIDH